MSFNDLGYEIIDNLISEQEAKALLADLASLKREPLRGGFRRIDQLVPQVAELAASSTLLAVARRHLAGTPALVRAIYFDKSPDHNWFVTWHQDRTVAVSRRFDKENWGPWSLKAGAWHVQPPLEVLENMVTIRVHLDPATTGNGCLKVLPGSHRLGLLSGNMVHRHVDGERVVCCQTEAGGAVVMRPHLLHASAKALEGQVPRRILHFEYSCHRLPEGIAWCA